LAPLNGTPDAAVIFARCLAPVKDARYARAAARSPSALLDGFAASRGSEFGRGWETAFQPNWETPPRPMWWHKWWCKCWCFWWRFYWCKCWCCPAWLGVFLGCVFSTDQGIDEMRCCAAPISAPGAEDPLARVPDGVATSAKTLDTSAASYTNNPSLITSTLNSYVNKMVNFGGNDLLPLSDIHSSNLELAIPESTSPTQWAAIQNSINYASSKGINLIVTLVK